jgi:Protein of unknown function (DUF2637)
MERHPESASSPSLQASTGPRRNWLHRVVNVVVAIVVLAVAAGMFFLSYPGVHAIAIQGGVSGRLARFYPALFDAVLVIACVAAVMLRGARWWARGWAWLVAIVILGAIGATDVLHAMSYGLRQRPTEGVVAAAPVAAVLLAFSLFLTMLRQSRSESAGGTPGQAPDFGPAEGGAGEQPTAPMTFSAVDIVPVRPPAPPIALPPVPVVVTDEAAPTREMPAVAADREDVGQEPEVVEPGTADPSTVETEAVEPEVIEPEAVEPEVIESEAAGPEVEVTVPEPAAAPEAATVPAPEPIAETADDAGDEAADEPSDDRDPESAAPTVPQPIRYASSAAAEQFGDEDWEAEVDPALAGQVYPVLTSDPDIEVPPHQPGQSQDLEDDAPPFATAPFASVPRLNRVRVSPTPPTDDAAEDEDEE